MLNKLRSILTDQSKAHRIENKCTYLKYIELGMLRHLIPPSPLEDINLIGMAESIRRLGMLMPATAYFNSNDGHYYLISGERRCAALILLGRSRILCRVITSAETCDALILAEHCTSSARDSFRAASALKYLTCVRGYDIRDLSQRSGMTTSRISALLSLEQLSSEEKRMLTVARLPEDVCCEIARIDDTSIRRAVAEHMSSLRLDVNRAIRERRPPRVGSCRAELIDNSVTRLATLIGTSGLDADVTRSDTETGTTYTINVNKRA